MHKNLAPLLRSGLAAGLLALAAAAPAAAQARDFPDKPVRIIVPFTAGGGSDMVARVVAEKLGAKWKQPVVVENRPGAGGALGAALVAKAPGDGTTLLLSDASAVTINPSLYRNLPYTAEQLKPVVNAGIFAMVAVVPEKSPFHTLADALAADKRKPGTVSVASSGIGSSTHLTLEMINAITGAKLAHVPYKGGGQGLTDLVGGQVDMMISGFNSALMQMIRTGKIRPIAVSTASRIPALPEVPTFQESGVASGDLASAQSVFAPQAIDDARLDQIVADMNDALQSQDVREKWETAGLLPFKPQSPQEVAAWFAREQQRWATLIRDQHITAE